MSILNHIISANPIAWFSNWIFKNITVFSELAQYIYGIILRKASSDLRNLLFLLGVGSLTYKFAHAFYKQLRFWSFLPQHLCNQRYYRPQSFKQRYGDCFVLITGAADGIGYAYAREFAKLGFSLIMADIQDEKLAARKESILAAYPNIKVQTFVVDMSNEQKIQEFLQNIEQLDVGILINNVGISGGGPYFDINLKAIERTLFVNYRPMYILNRNLIPKLRTRKERSAIINMTSSTGHYISHKVGTYSSIKHAGDIYSCTLAQQNKDKIDVLTVRPFGVTTGIVRMRKEERFITPQQCVSAILKDLGKTDTTFSALPHKILGAFFQSINEQQRLDLFDKAWNGANVAK